MILPPTRADLATGERLARRALGKSKDQDIRKLAKSLLEFAQQADEYVESLYPCFKLVEDEVRKNLCSLGLESDGVWRLRSPDGSVRQTGATLKDLFINVALWDTKADDDDFRKQCAEEEDAFFEGEERKNPPNPSAPSV